MKKAFFVTACMLSITLSAQVITSNFNTDADGWQKRDAPAGGLAGAIYQPTGGNPGGHISAKDILPVSTMYFVAPAKFLGNKSWAYNNNFSFDLKIETGTFFSEDDLIIEGNGVTLVLDFPNPTTSWTTFTCTLNENSGWRVGTRNGAVATKADILNALCNITRIWIRAEFFSNFLQFDEGYLDNVRLTVTPCFSVLNRKDTLCQGKSVVLNGKTYNATGIYTDTIRRCYPLCDSVINLNLTVVNAFKSTLNPTICAGSTFKIGTKTYNQTGIYKDTLKSIGGCDSIITTNLTVLPPLSISRDTSICDTYSIKVGTKTYNQTGIYRDTFRTLQGCDSIVITHLTVNKSYTTGQNVSICPSGSYTIGTHTYTQAGVYQDILKTINGCDSIVTTTLSIETASSRTQKVNLCAGQTLPVGTHTYTQTGIYRDTFRTLQGCDSIVITNLTINPVFFKNQDTTICSGNSLKIGNKTYNKTGIYRDTLKTIASCDSIIQTNLKILPPLSILRDSSLCEGDFIKIGNKIYNQTGIYRDTLQTNKGCDSIVVTNLIVNKSYDMPPQNVAICPNSFYKIGTHSYTQTGIYRDTFRTIKGCDSIITTVLSLYPIFSKNKDTVICQGNSLKIGTKTYNQTGIYRDTFKTINNCDSILITNLIVNPNYLKNQDTSICLGNSLRIGTKTYNRTGIYRDTLQSISGCDSIINTNLTILSPLSISRNSSICEGDFIKIGNKTYNQTGIYRDTLQTNKGCDSIVITNLTVNKRYTMPTQNVAICPNSFYKIGTHSYTQVGIYRDTLTTSKGCDSIVTTNLSFNAVYSQNIDRIICYGDIFQIGNKNYNKTGIYRDTLRTIKGCDSIIITNLTVKPERKQLIDSTICEGKKVIINYKTYQLAGTYGDTILTNAQCDSILFISLKVKPLPIIKKTAVLCANDSAIINGRLFTKIGIFRDTIISPINCNEIIEWTVQKSPLQLNMGINPLIELGDSIRLTPSVSGASNVLWTWQSNKALSCMNCPNPFAKPLITTLFTVIVKDTTTNCTVHDAIKVTIKACENIFMPTAFSPNNDGENDYFSVFASGCVRKVNKMQLFNRWGIMVFSKDNFLPNDEKNGWDGKMNNILLPPDVYIYVIELELGNGKTKLFSGDVTLIR